MAHNCLGNDHNFYEKTLFFLIHSCIQKEKIPLISLTNIKQYILNHLKMSLMLLPIDMLYDYLFKCI